MTGICCYSWLTRPADCTDRGRARARSGEAEPNTPAILVLNKIDLLKDKARLLPCIERYRGLHDFADYIPISARNGREAGHACGK